MIAIVVITHNRAALLAKCLENVLGGTSDATTEIVIWDNASTDGTGDLLERVADPRVRVVHSPENVGMNGYARGFRMTVAPYLVELDDDVVDAPRNWDRTMLDAFVRLPEIGFLASDLVDDPFDEPSHYRYRVRPHEYIPYELNGVRLLKGPAGGGCAMTTRELVDRVGGFPEHPGKVFWQEETEYQERISGLGFGSAVLADLRVHHTGGPHYTKASHEKQSYWDAYFRDRARRDRVKALLIRVPFVRNLNAKHGWFQPPSTATSVRQLPPAPSEPPQ